MIHGFIRPRLVRLGIIRLGEKAISQKGSEYPKDLDHFRVPEEVAQATNPDTGEPYGDTPKVLNIRVPSADIEQWFPYSLKRYSKDGKLWCRGDGQIARCFDEATGEWAERPCLYKDCEFYAGKKCTEIGVLQFILPDVDLRGVYQIATGSWHAINNVYQEFGTFLDIVRATIGPIADQAIMHVPFKLTRELQTLEYVDEKDGKRKSREKWLVHLRAPRLNLTDLEELRQRCTMPVSGYLPPGAQNGDADYSPSLSDDDVALDGEIMPDEDDTMPADLVAGASPQGPDMGQRSQWVALLEKAQGLGKNIEAAERTIVKRIAADAGSFTDLSSAEADRALSSLTDMVEMWRQAATEAPAAAAPQPAHQAAPQPAAPAPQPTAATADATGGLDF